MKIVDKEVSGELAKYLEGIQNQITDPKFLKNTYEAFTKDLQEGEKVGIIDGFRIIDPADAERPLIHSNGISHVQLGYTTRFNRIYIHRTIYKSERVNPQEAFRHGSFIIPLDDARKVFVRVPLEATH